MNIELHLPTRTITATIPKTWTDCVVQAENGTRNPALAITLLETLQLTGAGLLEKRIAILRHLLGLTEKDIREWQLSLSEEHGKEWQPIFFEQIQTLLSSTDFLLEETPDSPLSTLHYQLSATLTRSPFPVLPLSPELYAPADDLANITGWELALLFDLYTQYAETKDEALVDQLIATMYRKSKEATPENLDQNWYGDRRQPFNEHTVAVRQHQVATIPAPAKNIILFWFLSCRMAIITRFSDIFQSSRPDEIPGGKDFGWWAIFRQLSGNLKDTEAFAHMNHLDLLTELDFLKDERRREEMRAAMAG